MSVINILSPHVADLIAAGEVVERPSSVVKELLENAVDAGAKNIICEIQNGGSTYIRVTDDGCGMTADDAGIAFTRHATSKLKDEHGLESISTMGFRGEALAAISSVSRIELVTRQPQSSEGTRIILDGGDICDMSSFGCPDGTTIIVKDLFFNTPARQKFLKSDRSEASACTLTALRCALSHPDISIRMIKDNSEEFFSPGDGRIDSCIYSLLGRDEAASMLSCKSSLDSMRLAGYISSPSDCRGNRTHQFFFVNGRFIKSQLLQTALEQAYKNSLLTGRYPSCVLYLSLPFNAVDVNVHPAKTEIRFANEKAVFDFIYQSVKLALEGEDRLTSIPSVLPQPQQTASPKTTLQNTVWQQDYLASGSIEYEPQTKISSEIFYPTVQNSQETQKPISFKAFSQNAEKDVENSVQNVEKTEPIYHNILGEAFKTYIIVEQNGEILLIDKHAAHERIIFDRLKLNAEEIPSQLLISPETISVSDEDSEIIEKNGSLLTSLGFEIEPFGQNTFIVRGVPADMNAGDIPASLEEICEKLKQEKTLSASSVRDEILHTVACKAAIKAGWNTSNEELHALVDAVTSEQIKYCPHGRPVSVIITKEDLGKLFKRIT